MDRLREEAKEMMDYMREFDTISYLYPINDRAEARRDYILEKYLSKRGHSTYKGRTDYE